MAGPSSRSRGWHWDEENSRLSVWVNGTEVARFDDVTSDLALLVNGMPRSSLSQNALVSYNIPLYSLRQQDQAVMGISGTSGDHFYDIATNSPVLSGNTPSSSTVTDISTFDFPLPPEYDDAESVEVVISCQVDATADTNTIDLSCFEVTSLSGAVGSDLVSTSIQTTTASAVAYTFAITSSGLVAGDLLHFLMTTVNNDADGSDGIISIHSVRVRIDVKG